MTPSLCITPTGLLPCDSIRYRHRSVDLEACNASCTFPGLRRRAKPLSDTISLLIRITKLLQSGCASGCEWEKIFENLAFGLSKIKTQRTCLVATLCRP